MSQTQPVRPGSRSIRSIRSLAAILVIYGLLFQLFFQALPALAEPDFSGIFCSSTTHDQPGPGRHEPISCTCPGVCARDAGLIGPPSAAWQGQARSFEYSAPLSLAQVDAPLIRRVRLNLIRGPPTLA